MNDITLINQAIDRYFSIIDLRTFGVADFAAALTDDAVTERPDGHKTIGLEAIASGAQTSFARFSATQHMTGGSVIRLTGDTTAEYRVNISAMHIWAEGFGDQSVPSQDNYFLAGGVVTGIARKLADGQWKIAAVRNDVVWRQGNGFQQMLHISD